MKTRSSVRVDPRILTSVLVIDGRQLHAKADLPQGKARGTFDRRISGDEPTAEAV
jgi:hypothetical protein